MKGDKKNAFALFDTINIDEYSNFQRLDHNTVIYLFIQLVIEGASDGLELKFKLAKKTSHLDLLKYHNAIALNKSYTCK